MFSKAAALINARQDGGGGGSGGDTSSTDQLLDLLSDPFKSQVSLGLFSIEPEIVADNHESSNPTPSSPRLEPPSA